MLARLIAALVIGGTTVLAAAIFALEALLVWIASAADRRAATTR